MTRFFIPIFLLVTSSIPVFAQTEIQEPNYSGILFLASTADEIIASSYPDLAPKMKALRKERANGICSFYNLGSAKFGAFVDATENNAHSSATLIDAIENNGNVYFEANVYRNKATIYCGAFCKPLRFKTLICNDRNSSSTRIESEYSEIISD